MDSLNNSHRRLASTLSVCRSKMLEWWTLTRYVYWNYVTSLTFLVFLGSMLGRMHSKFFLILSITKIPFFSFFFFFFFFCYVLRLENIINSRGGKKVCLIVGLRELHSNEPPIKYVDPIPPARSTRREKCTNLPSDVTHCLYFKNTSTEIFHFSSPLEYLIRLLLLFTFRRETMKRAFAWRHFFVIRGHTLVTLWTNPFYILSACTGETKFTVKRFDVCAFLSP